MADDTPFLARWSRRKAAARAGATWPEAPAPAAEPTQASAGQAAATLAATAPADAQAAGIQQAS